MPLPSLKEHIPPDERVDREDVQRLQDNSREWINSLKTAFPLSDGVLHEDVDLTTSATDLAHRLGRKWRGCIPVRSTAQATIIQTRVSDTADRSFIRLTASASTTMDLWVF